MNSEPTLWIRGVATANTPADCDAEDQADQTSPSGCIALRGKGSTVTGAAGRSPIEQPLLMAKSRQDGILTALYRGRLYWSMRYGQALLRAGKFSNDWGHVGAPTRSTRPWASTCTTSRARTGRSARCPDEVKACLALRAGCSADETGRERMLAWFQRPVDWGRCWRMGLSAQTTTR